MISKWRDWIATEHLLQFHFLLFVEVFGTMLLLVVTSLVWLFSDIPMGLVHILLHMMYTIILAVNGYL